jgi:hypothetical protein
MPKSKSRSHHSKKSHKKRVTSHYRMKGMGVLLQMYGGAAEETEKALAEQKKIMDDLKAKAFKENNPMTSLALEQATVKYNSTKAKLGDLLKSASEAASKAGAAISNTASKARSWLSSKISSAASSAKKYVNDKIEASEKSKLEKLKAKYGGSKRRSRKRKAKKSKKVASVKKSKKVSRKKSKKVSKKSKKKSKKVSRKKSKKVSKKSKRRSRKRSNSSSY